jgi:hypothetical protein
MCSLILLVAVFPPIFIFVILAVLLCTQTLRRMDVRRAYSPARLVVVLHGWGARHVTRDQEDVDGSYVYMPPSNRQNIDKGRGEES